MIPRGGAEVSKVALFKSTAYLFRLYCACLRWGVENLGCLWFMCPPWLLLMFLRATLRFFVYARGRKPLGWSSVCTLWLPSRTHRSAPRAFIFRGHFVEYFLVDQRRGEGSWLTVGILSGREGGDRKGPVEEAEFPRSSSLWLSTGLACR